MPCAAVFEIERKYMIISILSENTMKTNSSQITDKMKRKRGWHSLENPRPPRLGKGSATVSPLRGLDEIARIRLSLTSTPRDHSLFIVGIHVGLRAGDLLSLKWNDVLDENRITSKIRIREEKTGNMRQIALQPQAREALESWRAEKNSESFVWPNRSGGKLSVQRLHQLVNFWCSKANVRGHFGTHTLRKTYGYHLRRLGYDIELLMRIFGHSSASVTLRYIGIEQDQIDEANLKLVL